MVCLSKISGLKLCQAYRKQYGCDFISCTNKFIQTIDNFHPLDSHVPAALKKVSYNKINKYENVEM